MIDKGGTFIIYSIVIPVFNGAKTLKELCGRIVKVMEKMGQAFEIVMVDDGSKDCSWEIIQSLAKKDYRFRGIQLMHNFGQPCAVMAGLQNSKGQSLITLDDDLQNPPEEITKLVEKMKREPELDVILGVPRQKQHALWRRCGSAIVNRFTNKILGFEKSLKLTNFRLMRREVIRPLLDLNLPRPLPATLLLTITKRIKMVEVEHCPRKCGQSNYTVSKLFELSVSKLIGFSSFLFHLLIFLGIAGLGVSGIFGLIIIILYTLGSIAALGWIIVALCLITLLSFNFIVLGIFGEYLHHILLCARRIPAYIIRSRVGFAQEKGEVSK